MKKITLLLVTALVSIGAFAQEQGKVRVDVNLGYAIPSGGGGGLALYLEPKYNIADNMSVGLRFGAAVMAKEIESNDGAIEEAEIGTSASYLGTFDYYYGKPGSSFAPFVGAGLGYYSVASVELSEDSIDEDDDLSGENEIDADGKFGGMLRAGFNWGGFKLELDYNLVPKSDLRGINNEEIGTTKNSYFGMTLGFFIGGGKWKNR